MNFGAFIQSNTQQIIGAKISRGDILTVPAVNTTAQ